MQFIVSHLVNEPELLTEAKRHLAEIEEQSELFHDACWVLGIVPGFARANYAGHRMGEQLRDLSQQLLNCGIEVDADDECSGHAINRVIYNIAPSKKGGEAKDCTILEEYPRRLPPPSSRGICQETGFLFFEYERLLRGGRTASHAGSRLRSRGSFGSRKISLGDSTT